MITLDHGTHVTRRRPRLRFHTASRGAEERTLEEAVVVGSAEEAGVCLPDRTVSRLHAELAPRADGLWVRDLGSKNGTFIGDVRVESARVPEGGTIRMGAVTISVAYETRGAPIESWSEDRFGRMVGGSPVMRVLFARLSKIAASDASVLVHGETGTGKELVAEALHAASARRGGPFVVVDCAALPETLLESELFGHAKGAFTGAIAAREGAIESAEGGTVFLDEIGELPLGLQPKLLRALESKRVRRVGETDYRAVDVRWISASHRDLRRMVNEGTFREDLYFRLAVLGVDVPPLRERSGDLGRLLSHLLGPEARLATPAVVAALESKALPGNVRELRNFAERLRALGPDEALSMLEGREREPERSSARPPADSLSRAERDPLAVIRYDTSYRDSREEVVERFERAYFGELLSRHGRNVAEAARAAGVDRTYVYRMIRRHGI